MTCIVIQPGHLGLHLIEHLLASTLLSPYSSAKNFACISSSPKMIL